MRIGNDIKYALSILCAVFAIAYWHFDWRMASGFCFGVAWCAFLSALPTKPLAEIIRRNR